MNTVIFKWNPGFSSYNMHRYLDDLARIVYEDVYEMNWSVWDFDKIKKGDRFHMMKLGYGAKGLVACGTITSDPYEDEDWSGQGRPTRYVDFEPDILINPDALPILDIKTLEAEIPDFEWGRGHSGLVLTEAQAEKLDALWKSFVDTNRDLFEERAANKNSYNDRFYCKK